MPMDKISETAFLVALYRAIESERPDALFCDPLARRLAGGQGALQSAILGQPQRGADAIAIRTRSIDDLIGRLVRDAGIDTVLNLAAGLDTRPYRLSLPPTLRWIEIDLPEILAYKAQILDSAAQESSPNVQYSACCQVQQISLDLNSAQRNTVFAGLNAATNNALVVTEGLLSYFSSEAVAALAADLYRQPHFRWRILELLPPLARTSRPYAQNLFDQYYASGKNAFQFRPVEGAAFFSSYGWQVAELGSIWKESLRLRRGFQPAWFWKWFLRLFAPRQWRGLNQSGIVLLKRQPSAALK